MEVNVKIKIKPFRVPNNVIIEGPPVAKEDGFKPAESMPLSALDASTLGEMCEAFTRGVFERAGKQRPPRSE